VDLEKVKYQKTLIEEVLLVKDLEEVRQKGIARCRDFQN
jgi:hypothetical protein